MNEHHDDLIENPSPRCAVALVLDTSASMGGAPIQQLNEGVQLFIDSVQRDDIARWSVDLAVYTLVAGPAACRISSASSRLVAWFRCWPTATRRWAPRWTWR